MVQYLFVRDEDNVQAIFKTDAVKADVENFTLMWSNIRGHVLEGVVPFRAGEETSRTAIRSWASDNADSYTVYAYDGEEMTDVLEGVLVAPTVNFSISGAEAEALFTFTVDIAANDYVGETVNVKFTVSPYNNFALQYSTDSGENYTSLSSSTGEYTYEDVTLEETTTLYMRAKENTAGTYSMTVEVVTTEGETLASSTQSYEITEASGG